MASSRVRLALRFNQKSTKRSMRHYARTDKRFNGSMNEVVNEALEFYIKFRKGIIKLVEPKKKKAKE